MASKSETIRRLYGDLVKRRARVRVSPAVEPQLTAEPIFLTGIYRSGTTLLRYVIDSHSSIACPPESDFMAHLDALWSDERSREGLAGLGFDREHVHQQLRRFAGYFFEGYAHSKGKPRWADKSPRYVDHLPFLAELFPEARFIILHRHPLDQIHSATRGGSTFPAALVEWAGTADGDPRISAAGYWSEKTRNILTFVDTHPERTFTLRYEEMCESPETTLPALFEYVGEPWEPGVLEFYRFEHDRGMEDGRAAATRGFALSTGKWQAWDPAIVDECREIVGTEMRHLGYEPIASPG